MLSGQDRTVENEHVLWFHYSQKVRVNDKWQLLGRVQYRDFLDREEFYHFFLSINASRKLKNGIAADLGFTNLNVNRRVGDQYVLVPELRPYQRLHYTVKHDKMRFSLRVIAEQRWFRNAAEGTLVEGYNYRWRFRNKLLFIFPIVDKLSLELSSEVMVNAGRQVVINLFDQHRGIVQFHWNLAPFKIMTGYMHWFFQTAANQHQNRHTLLLGLSHELDFSGGSNPQ